jgi:hypothetical protein
MSYRWMFLVLLAVGVLQRLIRFFLGFPIWGDEAFICLNVLDRSPSELAGPLRFDQVAPVLYLWVEWAVLHLLGPSELSLRLPALLAGLASLVMFARLARHVLPGPAALIAVGIFAVSYYPVRHSCEVKPYAFDLFASLLLMTLAAEALRWSERLKPMVLLIILVPVVLASSYPAVFTAGAVSLALLHATSARRASEGSDVPRLRIGLVWTFTLIVPVCFAAMFLLVGRQQHASMVDHSSGYWDTTFPPAQPVELARWLIDAHTGNMLAYPIGGRNGGSLLTLLACLVGVVVLMRHGRWSFVILLLVPFLLNFIAAAPGKYPYGGAARVAQHLAPSICLLAGLGLATLFRRAVVPVCVLLVLFGVASAVRDVHKPYKTRGDEQVRALIHEIARRPGRIAVVAAPPRLYPSLEWYLRLLGDRVVWVDDVETAPDGVWCLRFRTNAESSPESTARETFILELGEEEDATRYCEVWQK